MRTPCCQSLRSNRLVVSEYEVPKVWFPQECKVFCETPCSFYEVPQVLVSQEYLLFLKLHQPITK